MRIFLKTTFALVAVLGAIPGTALAADRTVTNNDDAGAGSLRATIAAADPGDTVVIPAGIGTIVLTTGEIPIEKDLTIQGAGASGTVISGNHQSRVFCVGIAVCPSKAEGTPQPSLTVSDLKITAGRLAAAGNSDGGAGIYSSGGDLTLTRVRMTHNRVTFGNNVNDGGGAVYSRNGKLTITDSTLGPDNSVAGGPKAPAVNGGGAIYTLRGPVTLKNSHVDGNSATVGGGNGGSVNGGGGLYVTNDPLVLEDSTVNGNSASLTGPNGAENGGGGIYALGGTVTLTRSHADDNTLTIDAQPGFDNGGGGIVATGGDVTLDHSTASGNSFDMTGGEFSSSNGGAGISGVGDDVTLTDSTLADNDLSLTLGKTAAVNGGAALYMTGASLTALRSTIGPGNSTFMAVGADSQQNGGGAIYTAGNGGDPVLTDSTIVGNSLVMTGAGTTDGGGAIYQGGDAAAETKATLTNVTLAHNSASGALGGAIALGVGSATFKNSIVAANTAPLGFDCVAFGSTATVASAGGNVATVDGCGLGEGDRIVADAQLGPLGNNGGPTETVALLAGSPAIGIADACGATDQRGVTRPKGNACDAGAYELAPPDVVTGAASGIGVGGATIAGSVNPNLRRATYSFEYGTTADYGSRTAAADAGDGLSAVPVTAGVDGLQPDTTYHYRLVAENADGTSVADDATFKTAALPAGPPPPPPGKPVLTKLVVKARKGTSSFVLSRAANVRLVLAKAKGKRHRFAMVRRLTVPGKSGRNVVRLSRKPLARGRYRLTATPAQGKSLTATFKVVTK